MDQNSKLGKRVISNFLVFSLFIIFTVTIFISAWSIAVQSSNTRDYMNDFLNITAEMIDGDRIETYLRTGEKDDYYYYIQNYLSVQIKHSDLKYLYVVVPKETEYVFVWDGTNPVDTVDLGYREAYESESEKRASLNAMNTDSKPFLHIVNADEYGVIASLKLPITDSSGKPVAVVGADIDVFDLGRVFLTVALINTIVVGILTIIAALIFYRKTYRNIVDPIKKLNQATKELINHLDTRENAKPFHVDIHTGDELEDLADSFSQMNSDLKRYINKLEKVTREQEKTSTELNVAATIQADMLPNTFPPFPDKKEFSIYALMNPARRVGGDFYDFFMIDDTHLCLVIADVSDKGVPAALFMVISKTLVKQRAEYGGTPAEILYEVNNKLCQDNSSVQFVTIWLMILDITTGKGMAANAGHETPLVRRYGQQFELLNDVHTMPIAAIPNAEFRDYELNLNPGDALFVYSDGATDATDPSQNRFSSSGILDALNTVKENDPKIMIDTVVKAIDDFAKGTPPFDDTTMLALCYHGNSSEPIGIKTEENDPSTSSVQ